LKPRGRHRGRTLVLAVGDGLVAVTAFSSAVLFRREVRIPWAAGLLPPEKFPLDLPTLAVVLSAALAALALAVTRDEALRTVRERGGLLVASLLTSGLLALSFVLAGVAMPRSVLLIFTPLLYVSLEAWRGLAERFVPIGERKVLVLGPGRDAERAVAALQAGEVVGHVLFAWWRDLSALRHLPVDGPDEPFSPEVQDIVFASELPEDRTCLVSILQRSAASAFELWLLPGLTDVLASRVVTRSLGDLPLAPVLARGATGPAFAVRRLVDLALGVPLTLLSLPLVAAASLAVVLQSPGPAWIRQRRVGRGGREFLLLKIRTMRVDAEEGKGAVLAVPEDPRITRLGRWLRMTRLDELPQLFHVISGRMSLIGPRPERPEFVSRFSEDLPAYPLRFLLKPGLTGLAQVMGGYATKPDVKLRYDLGYLFHWTPLLDLIILVRTVSTVLRGGGL